MVGLMVREAQVTGLDKMLSHDVLYSRPWPGAYTALATSCGYFAYDQLDMLRKRLYNPKAPSLLVHHAVLLTCFTPALQRNICINYLILTLICEVCNFPMQLHCDLFENFPSPPPHPRPPRAIVYIFNQKPVCLGF